MKKYFIYIGGLFLIMSGFLCVPKAHASNYQYYRSITVTSNTSIASGTNTNFPVLFSGNYQWLAASSSGGYIQKVITAPNGGQEPADVIFVTSTPTLSGATYNCGTSLNFETEAYTPSTGVIKDWVNVPSVSPGAVLYVCYDNSSVTTDQSHPSSTWNSNYAGVWHLPNGTTLSANDSTVNGNNGTINGSPSAINGIISGGANFGSSDNLGISPINLSGVSYTISSWFETPFPSTGSWNTLTRGTAGDHQVIINEGSSWNLGVYDNSSGFYGSGFNMSTLSTGWHYLVAEGSGSATNFYIDGSFVGTAGFKSSRDIGYLGNYQGGGQQFGDTDEIRVSTNVARSPSWILSEYNNQKNPSGFYSLGPVTGGTGYTYYRSITVTSTTSVASGTNANFPMLFSSTYSWLESSSTGGGAGRIQDLVSAPNGGQEPADLMFTATSPTPAGSKWNCGNSLYFETESYVSSTGAINDWINIPSLSAGTVLYACYGNSGVTVDQSNPAAVWNSNYAGVWHFPNGPVSNDSTADANNVTTNSGFTSSAGKIDGGTNNTGGANTYLEVPSSPSLQNFGAMSISAWVNLVNYGNNGPTVVNLPIADTSAVSPYAVYTLAFNTNGTLYARVGNGSLTGSLNGNASVPTGGWHYVEDTYDGSNALTTYIDGAEDATANVGAFTGGTSAAGEYFGAYNQNNSYQLDGSTDEIHISKVGFSPSWITTEYNDQSSPSTFYSVGSETAAAPPSGPSQDAPVNGGQGISLTPTFLMTATDTYSAPLQYKVTIYSNSGCTSVVQTDDQTASQAGWSGQNALSSQAYTSGTQGSFTVQSALSPSTTYYWQSSAEYAGASNAWVNSATCNSFATGGAWTTDSGSWSIVSNKLVVTPGVGNYVQLHVNGQSITNDVVEFKVSASGGSAGDTGAILRADASSNRYQLGDVDYVDQLHRIGKTISNSYSTITSSALTVSASTVYDVRGYANGSSLQSWINGGTALSTSDSALGGSGFIGIGASGNNTFTYSDFAIYTSPTITLSNLPSGGSWSALDHTGATISCNTGNTWGVSTYNGQVPIDYDNGGGSIAVWTNNSCSGTKAATYPSSGNATDIFGGDTYLYSASSGAVAEDSSTIMISSVGLVSD